MADYPTDNKALISFENYLDRTNVTLASPGELTELGAGNVVEKSIQTCFRSPTPSSYIDVDLRQTLPIGVVAFAVPRSGLMIGPTDPVRIQLDSFGGIPGSGALFDTGDLPSGIHPSFGYFLLRFPAGTVARYIRVFVNVAPSGLPYFQIGRLWIGTYPLLNRNFNFGWARAWAEPGGRVVEAPRSGVHFRNSGPRKREVVVTFPAMNEATADAMEDGDILVGMTGQILLCTQPLNPARRTLFGTPTAVRPIQQTAAPMFSTTYSVKEDL